MTFDKVTSLKIKFKCNFSEVYVSPLLVRDPSYVILVQIQRIIPYLHHLNVTQKNAHQMPLFYRFTYLNGNNKNVSSVCFRNLSFPVICKLTQKCLNLFIFTV